MRGEKQTDSCNRIDKVRVKRSDYRFEKEHFEIFPNKSVADDVKSSAALILLNGSPSAYLMMERMKGSEAVSVWSGWQGVMEI